MTFNYTSRQHLSMSEDIFGCLQKGVLLASSTLPVGLWERTWETSHLYKSELGYSITNCSKDEIFSYLKRFITLTKKLNNIIY